MEQGFLSCYSGYVKVLIIVFLCEVVIAGINYDKETKEHKCVIERKNVRD